MKTLAAAAVAASLWAGAAAAQTPPPEDPALIAYLRDRAKEALDTTRYTAAITPDGAMTLVYLTGPNWCGSGGCRLLVLDRTDVREARAPLRMLMPVLDELLTPLAEDTGLVVAVTDPRGVLLQVGKAAREPAGVCGGGWQRWKEEGEGREW